MSLEIRLFGNESFPFLKGKLPLTGKSRPLRGIPSITALSPGYFAPHKAICFPGNESLEQAVRSNCALKPQPNSASA